MTPKERAAMQQALEALHAELEAGTCEEFENAAEKCYEAIAALQEALAEQAEQEPVAWMFVFEDGECDPNITFDLKEQGEKWLESDDCLWDGSIAPVYAAPVRTKDLTDDEIRAIWLKVIDPDGGDEVMALARAVIAADREKNK